MMHSNQILLPFAVFIFIFILCFSPSSAHNKTHTPSTPTPNPPPTSNPTPDPSSSVSYKGAFSKVYAFGDSYTDTGNARLLGGLTSFIGALMRNSPYCSSSSSSGLQNRLSDGKLVIDYLCEALSLPYLPPYKDTSLDFSHGVNFAVAGSTALSTDYYINNRVGQTLVWKDIPQTVQTQVNWFNKFLLNIECNGMNHQACKGQLENSLFWVGELGMYDYSRTYGSSVSIKWLIDLSVSSTCRLVKTLLDRGAKYIVVQSLPPTGCLPFDISLSPVSDHDNLGCADTANTVTQTHNELLQAKLAEQQKQYPDSIIAYADIWNAYYTVLKNPIQFGFSEPFKACCGCGKGELNFDLRSLCGARNTRVCSDPSKHITWDGVHLTEAMHHVLADLLLNKGYCKPSFDQLVKKKRSCTAN
ncbi:GDSL esterase/lipase At3g48460-like [Vitis riparia]|uniref:GDSL esterase/lipase At3g48460-like n=1 Tax=Vitis riparia TaxID=96939 RepID=UPI00155A2F54|nr:GDSL esterase/lipase At3g48460-like [Vitis riparia]